MVKHKSASDSQFQVWPEVCKLNAYASEAYCVQTCVYNGQPEEIN